MRAAKERRMEGGKGRARVCARACESVLACPPSSVSGVFSSIHIASKRGVRARLAQHTGNKKEIYTVWICRGRTCPGLLAFLFDF